jgi:DNA polymerase-4
MFQIWQYPSFMSLRWLFLDLNSYFASVEQQLNPRLRGHTVVVAPMASDTTSAIATSVEAKRLGIKTGTPIWEARQRCPGIAVLVARHTAYIEFHHKVMSELNHHMPVDTIYSIDEAACRLTGRQQDPDEAVRLARRIKAGLRARVGECITCSIGLAPSRLLAKIATDMQKPDGLVMLPAAGLPGPLLPLNLIDLPGIGPNMQRRLNRYGVYTLSALWALTPRQARAIWGGVMGERFLRSLRGEDLNMIEHRRKTTVGHSHVLAPHQRPAVQARLVARHLATKAAARLRGIGHVASRLYLSVRVEGGPRWGAEFRLRPTDDSAVILHGLDRLWDRLLPHDGVRLKKVSLALYALTPRSDMTLDAFDWLAMTEKPRQPRTQLPLDAINARYGRNAITLGPPPNRQASYTGPKIAFARIPGLDE